MGVATNENTWWNDVLKHGRLSRYADSFDIRWQDDALAESKVLLPMLGKELEGELEARAISIDLDDALYASYGDRRVPLSIRSYKNIFELFRQRDDFENQLGELTRLTIVVQTLNAQLFAEERSLPKLRLEFEKVNIDFDRKFRSALAIPQFREALSCAVSRINNRDSSTETLRNVLQAQNFRFAFWKTADREVNFRRFFASWELAAIASERNEVFDASHQLLLKIAAQEQCGFRIDHPDGLSDPCCYFFRLQSELVLQRIQSRSTLNAEDHQRVRSVIEERLSEIMAKRSDLPLFVVAEKILAADEALPAYWMIDGTTGYEFLVALNSLFVAAHNEKQFTALYAAFAEVESSWTPVVRQGKREVLETLLKSEINCVAKLAHKILTQNAKAIELFDIITAVREFIVFFPVYRSYRTIGAISETDRQFISMALEDAKRDAVDATPKNLELIAELLTKDFSEADDDSERELRQTFIRRFQQLSAPTTAKGAEDTAFYRYNRLISLNEVGGDPRRFGIPIKNFHEFQTRRSAQTPRALSALSTHDTKRSEDVRARINVLSEIPEEWRERLDRWSAVNTPHRVDAAPSRNEEYYIYQTLLGAWPAKGEITKDFLDRMHVHFVKSLREAKIHSSWIDPNDHYENSVLAFIDRILADDNVEFLKDYSTFARRIVNLGLLNSISQTVGKFMLPGIPDTFQGTETWNFSLTDPDNRRLVDFETLEHSMREVLRNEETIFEMKNLANGQTKLALSRSLAKVRDQFPEVFQRGEYIPLSVYGPLKNHLIAFARRNKSGMVVVVFARFFVQLVDEFHKYNGDVWTNEFVQLDSSLGENWRSVFKTNHHQSYVSSANRINIHELLSDYPFAVITNKLVRGEGK